MRGRGFLGHRFFKHLVNPLFSPIYHVPGVDKMIMQMPPAFPKPTPLAVAFPFTFLSYAGTGILVAAIIAGFVMGFTPLTLIRHYLRTCYVVRYPILTITAMLALGSVTSAAGLDGTLGLAFARTGFFYPFFGTMLGWLGVAATGSDTAANTLFGGLQMITSHQLGVSSVLMAGSNSTGGVMGKIICISSIVVAVAATGWQGGEVAHPALRVLGLGPARLRRGRIGHAASLCLALHPDRSGRLTNQKRPA